MPSRNGRTKFLMMEKSVLIKFGPETGARGAVPSSPAGACSNAQGLNHAVRVCTLAGATQPGLAATGPPLFGSPTSSGRSKLGPLFQKKGTPEALLLPLATTK